MATTLHPQDTTPVPQHPAGGITVETAAAAIHSPALNIQASAQVCFHLLHIERLPLLHTIILLRTTTLRRLIQSHLHRITILHQQVTVPAIQMFHQACFRLHLNIITLTHSLSSPLHTPHSLPHHILKRAPHLIPGLTLRLLIHPHLGVLTLHLSHLQQLHHHLQ